MLLHAISMELLYGASFIFKLRLNWVLLPPARGGALQQTPWSKHHAREEARGEGRGGRLVRARRLKFWGIWYAALPACMVFAEIYTCIHI